MRKNRLLREVILVFLAVTTICHLLVRFQSLSPFLHNNLHVAVALLFLYLPYLILKRKGHNPTDYGLTSRPIAKNLLLTLVVVAITFPPYIVGFHLYQRHFLKQRADFSADLYNRWPMEWEGRPERVPAGGMYFFVQGPNLHLGWAGDAQGTPQFQIQTDAHTKVLAGERYFRAGAPQPERQHQGEKVDVKAMNRLSIHSPHPSRRGEAVISLKGGTTLKITPLLGNEPAPSSLIAVGRAGAPVTDPIDVERGLSWILWISIFHMLIIAIPEEVFFRGYVQTSLNKVFSRRVRLWGIAFSPVSILFSSALFALGHYLIDFGPMRFGVFFPSLLFGLMREATGSVGAASLYHALCNVYAELLGRGYLPDW